jgi:hypothetical protein
MVVGRLDTENASWCGPIKSLLASVEMIPGDDESCSNARERLCEDIFSIVAENIHDVLNYPLFSRTVLDKLQEWRFAPLDSGEHRIFEKFFFLFDTLQSHCNTMQLK